ncbi:hydrolethalus syndrome protein 1 [Coturnix japonica]|uniref:hydrolethalus syndrome protein 1 n=1 Tax=Coturnix japonica TaxID=93934 RepID=UPI000777BAB1|nr:hydrolethalus syndrome protein 1 [Coturnix japonica]
MDGLGAAGHVCAALSDEELEGGSEIHGADGAAGPSAVLCCSEGSRSRVMKRKVLRHRPDGGVEVCDESLSSVLQTMATWRLTQQVLGAADPCDGDTGLGGFYRPDPPPRLQRATRDSPPLLLRVLQNRSPLSSPSAAPAPQPKSFIPPRLDALLQSRHKTDRVAKYLQYKRDWERFPVPGQAPRHELRCCVRCRLGPELHNPPGRAARYRPNGYTAPSDKKRAALTWGVRCDLASGIVPRKSTSLL